MGNTGLFFDFLPSRLGLYNTPTARPPTSECPVYDTKQSDGEVPVMLELWRMQGTPLLPLLPSPLWPGMVASYRAISMC